MNKKIRKIIAITTCIGLIFSNNIIAKADEVQGSQTYQNSQDVPQILQQNNKNYRLVNTKEIDYNEDLGIFSTQHYNVWAGSYYITSGNGTWDTGFPNLPDQKTVTQDNHSFVAYRFLHETTEQLTQYCGTGYPRGVGTITNYQGDVVTITQQDPFVGAGNLRTGTGYITSVHQWHHGYVNNVYYGIYNEILDKTKPTLTLSQNPIDWTNGNVTISANAEDNGNPNDNYEEVSGVAEINMLDSTTNVWNKLNLTSTNTATTSVTQNGTYSFKCVDNIGNVSDVATINISNIDKSAPIVTGADNYVQDPTTEIAGTPKAINLNVTDPADNLGLYSGLSNIQLVDTTNNNNTILVNQNFDGEQAESINYVNDKEGKRTFEVVATDRAGNQTTKTFTHDIKPKLQILSLSNVCRVFGVDEIDTSEHIGPVNPSLKILTGTKGTMKINVKGAHLVEAEFYCNNSPIYGVKFDTTNEMVQYNKDYITYYNKDIITNGDNQDDNKITLKPADQYSYPYTNQTVSFNFILPNIGEDAVKKGSLISIKVTAYNQTGNIINNVVGENFFVVSDDVRNCIQTNNIR